MKIIIDIKYSEKMKLLELASLLKNKGHWGSSSFLTPEEENLVSIIQQSEDRVELSFSQLSLLLNWISESTSNGQFLLEEESNLINKFFKSINNYYEIIKNEYDETIIGISTTIQKLNDFNSKGAEKFSAPDIFYKNKKLLDRIEKLNKEISSLEMDNLKLQNELREIKETARNSSLSKKLFNKNKSKIFETDDLVIMKEKKKKDNNKKSDSANIKQKHADTQNDKHAENLYNKAKKQAKKFKNRF